MIGTINHNIRHAWQAMDWTDDDNKNLLIANVKINYPVVYGKILKDKDLNTITYKPDRERYNGRGLA